MRKKLTITLNGEVYNGLHKVVGRGKISRFVEDLVRPYVVQSYLETEYAQMALDRQREGEAREWAEGLMTDLAHASG